MAKGEGKGHNILKDKINMQHVEINIGKICNSKCLFCYDATLAPKNKKWISREEVEKELNYFFKKGFRSVDFVGGEPSIYPHIIEVIKKAKELGYRRIVIATNGKRFSDFSFAKKVIEAGLNRVTVSVHSSKKEVEDYFCLLYTSPSPRDKRQSRMPSSA